MHTLYNIVTGPLLWSAFIIFIGGSLHRLISMTLLAKEKDPIIFTYMSPYYSLRSILHWIIPFASINSRKNPILTIVTFAFHVCLLMVPIFLFAHIILWKESWNISWWYMSDTLADVMTIIVVAACIFFLVRRIILPQVRFLTSLSDFVILALIAAPFVTGFWTQHHWVGTQLMGILHILSGEIFLAIIPFTRLSHMLFFPFTRGYIGSEFGAIRKAKDW